MSSLEQVFARHRKRYAFEDVARFDRYHVIQKTKDEIPVPGTAILVEPQVLHMLLINYMNGEMKFEDLVSGYMKSPINSLPVTADAQNSYFSLVRIGLIQAIKEGELNYYSWQNTLVSCLQPGIVSGMTLPSSHEYTLRK